MSIQGLVDKIREWEWDAGESFTDYFLDKYSYGNLWLDFLLSKGYTDLVIEIQADTFTLSNGVVLTCTDQQLKFEPNTSEAGKWTEEVYQADVALWAEFILMHEDIYTDCMEFFEESDD